METSKTYYVVENLDSVGFFLVLEYADASPKFTRVADEISRYSSRGLAEDLVERIKTKGLTMELKVRQMEISYRIF